jgi:hypothetical protein
MKRVTLLLFAASLPYAGAVVGAGDGAFYGLTTCSRPSLLVSFTELFVPFQNICRFRVAKESETSHLPNGDG